MTSVCNASYDGNAMLMLSQVAKVLAAVYGMRANADPTLVVACLHAVRGLATRHEGNAHALGKETLLCIRSLSKANANNADLVGAPSCTCIVIIQSHQRPFGGANLDSRLYRALLCCPHAFRSPMSRVDLRCLNRRRNVTRPFQLWFKPPPSPAQGPCHRRREIRVHTHVLAEPPDYHLCRPPACLIMGFKEVLSRV